MKSFTSKDIRNVGFIGHKASGKTSVAESTLWSAKGTARLGKTGDGTSVLDFEEEEHKRVMSSGLHLGWVEWKKSKINLIDTPGDGNFLKDTRIAMQAMDAAVCLVAANHGVEPMTERVMDWAKEFELAHAIFISKMDVDNADFDRALADVKEHLCPEASAVQLPIIKDAKFKGVVDLLAQKAYFFPDNDSGEVTTGAIPADMKDAVDEARSRLIEDIAGIDESLMQKFFDGSLTESEIAHGLEKEMMAGKIVPVLCGSGLLNRGVSLLLDFCVEHFPSPLDRPARSGTLNGAKLERKQSATEPLSCLVFKTIGDPHAGRLSVLRVLSGTATPDTTLTNGHRHGHERLGTLNALIGKKLEPIASAEVGEIFTVAKLKDTHTGDTLSSDGWNADPISMPPALISRALHAKDKSTEDKLTAALHRVTEEDPGLIIGRDASGELLLSGSGQQHIEVAVEKMRRKFGVDVELSLPRIQYKETFSAAVKNVEGKHKKQSGGRGQFAVAHLDFEPGPRGSGFVFEDAVVGGSVPRQFIPSVEKGVLKALSRGLISGHPVVDIKVRLLDGKYHAVDSDDRSFQIAGSKGLKLAALKAKPVLLEPIMNVEITVPEANMGDVMGDVNSRRGRVMGSETLGRYSAVKAQVPLAEMQTYEPTLRAMTQGRGSFTMEESHLELVPPHLQEKLIKESGFVAAEEED